MTTGIEYDLGYGRLCTPPPRTKPGGYRTVGLRSAEGTPLYWGDDLPIGLRGTLIVRPAVEPTEELRRRRRTGVFIGEMLGGGRFFAEPDAAGRTGAFVGVTYGAPDPADWLIARNVRDLTDKWVSLRFLQDPPADGDATEAPLPEGDCAQDSDPTRLLHERAVRRAATE